MCLPPQTLPLLGNYLPSEYITKAVKYQTNFNRLSNTIMALLQIPYPA